MIRRSNLEKYTIIYARILRGDDYKSIARSFNTSVQNIANIRIKMEVFVRDYTIPRRKNV